MIDERMEELASLYALGALTPEETAQFEVTLRKDVELQRLVASLQAVTLGMAKELPPMTPPPELREKILAQIDTQEKIVAFPTGVSESRASWLPWALAACLAVICTVLASREAALRQRISELDSLASALQASTNDLQQTILTLNENNQLANLRIAMLGSLVTDQPKATAVSLWNEKDQDGVFVVDNLKAAPADQDYQLWVIDPQYKIPVDAGVFHVDATGKVRFPFTAKQKIATAGKFAVTQEQKGGSPTPKGSMVMVGE